MKILQVLSTLHPPYGGPVFVCKGLCRYLALAGHDVTIFTTNLHYPRGWLDLPLNQRVELDGYSVYYFNYKLHKYLWSPGLASALARHMPEFDIVHIHGLYRFPQTITAYYARKHGRPYLIRPYGSLDPFLYHKENNKLIKRIYERLIEFPNLNNAAAIHYTTEREKRVAQWLNLKAPGFIVPNGVNVDRFKPGVFKGRFREKHHMQGKRIILHYGRVNYKKGLDMLVDAFGILAKERDDVHLVIAGPDNESYSVQLKEWLKERGCLDRTLFTGMLNDDEALEVLEDADVFVLPSYDENFGVSVIEAMAMELPVVVSEHVGICHEITDAKAGLVTRRDTLEIVSAITRLIYDENDRREMGKRGRILSIEKFHWENVVQRLLREYEHIIETYKTHR